MSEKVWDYDNVTVRDTVVGGAAVDPKKGESSSSGTSIPTNWGNIPDKPSTFPPSAHTHPLGDLEQSGASVGQVATWSGSAWLPSDPVGGVQYIPLVDGAEPPNLISDGAGHLILVAGP